MPFSAEDVRNLVAERLEERGIVLVGIKVSGVPRKPLIQVFIDLKEEFITIGQCSRVARELSDLLILQENLPADYSLEVSSPGVDSPLTELWQFRKNLERWIHIYREAKTLEGKIIGVQEPDLVRLETEDGALELTLAEAAGARILLDPPHQGPNTKRKVHEARGR